MDELTQDLLAYSRVSKEEVVLEELDTGRVLEETLGT